MAADWNVDEALGEAIKRVAAGSALPLTDAEREDLRRAYRGPFQREHDRGVDWDVVRPIVLNYAHMIGMLATTFTSATALVPAS